MVMLHKLCNITRASKKVGRNGYAAYDLHNSGFKESFIIVGSLSYLSCFVLVLAMRIIDGHP